jgi:hypothetical protein
MLCSVPRLEQLAVMGVPVPVSATIWEMVDNDVVDGTPRLIRQGCHINQTYMKT